MNKLKKLLKSTFKINKDQSVSSSLISDFDDDVISGLGLKLNPVRSHISLWDCREPVVLRLRKTKIIVDENQRRSVDNFMEKNIFLVDKYQQTSMKNTEYTTKEKTDMIDTNQQTSMENLEPITKQKSYMIDKYQQTSMKNLESIKKQNITMVDKFQQTSVENTTCLIQKV